MIIIGVILGFQLIKLFFEIGEQYVIICILILLSPLGFAMGGSRATKNKLTGYICTFVSTVLMMVMNVLLLNLILSALATMSTGVMVFPWCILMVALSRLAHKIDNLITKVGLNPAITGDPLGRGAAGMLGMMATRTIY